jgi:hypothetical protein
MGRVVVFEQLVDAKASPSGAVIATYHLEQT